METGALRAGEGGLGFRLAYMHTYASEAEGRCLQVCIEGQWGGVEETLRHLQWGDSTCQVYCVPWAELQLVFPESPAL